MFYGSIVALVTPMKANRELDFTAFRRLIDMHMEQGTNAIVVAGTTGESAMLSRDELSALIRCSVEQVNGRIPIIAGTGAASTMVAIELTKLAMDQGADACLLMAPPYIKPTQEGLYQHFNTISNSVAIPQILYNVPGRTACDILPETVVRLAENPNIVGIKEATGNVMRAQMLISQCGDKLDVFSGDDAIALDVMLAGGKGVLSVTANVAPRQMHALCSAALAGEKERAQELNASLIPLHKALFVETNPIPVKWALQEIGLISEGIRLPLTPLSSEYHDVVRQALQHAKIL